MADTKKFSSIHNGHRGRIRERYLHSGMADMQDHEVLELLLTYAIPRKDVNPIAHELIHRFGSLSKVLDAPVRELEQINGMGASSALYLHMMTDVFRQYALDRVKPCETYDTVVKVGEYARALFVGENEEKAYVMLFDNGMHMIDCKLVASGTVNRVITNIRTIAELALFNKAANIVLTHNHPHGLSIPSRDDLNVNQDLWAAMEIIGIPLLEHIIVSEHTFNTTLRNSKGVMRAPFANSEVDEEFFRHFYGMDTEEN